MRSFRLLGSTAAILACMAVHSFAQNYPTRTARIVVPYAAGGNTDIVARLIAQHLTNAWGQQVIVDNRPGGATNIGSELVARAQPDGYTLLMGGASNAINMTLFRKPPYDTLKEFAPIVLCTVGANLLSVHPSIPAKNLRELMAMARARPGQLNFATSGIGSSNHMAGELFKLMANINITHVPYKGNTPALTDMVGGHVEMGFAGITSQMPLIKAGKLRPIALSSKERFPAVPEVPTFHESGLPGYESSTWFGMFAPAATSAEVIRKVNDDVAKILGRADIKERLTADGQIPGGGSSESFAKFVRDEIAKYAKVIKAAKVPLQ
ncbi:MAG: tripartite tricarboxylate transporter substrate binding protein [Burkholderiales bacterium]|nr:tripartite tricarboxylate transporter substrate binding protein [Burkholderiales bacterium]